MPRRPINRVFVVALPDLWGWRPKVEETLADVRAGRRSYHTGMPLILSRLGSGRQKFFVIDGYHRIVEALERGQRTLQAVISEHVPYIERTGGAFRSYLEDKVNIRRHGSSWRVSKRVVR